MNKVTNKLRVAHYPQVPSKPFTVNVKDEEQAYLVMKALSDQHIFLYKENMIPDYSNVVCVDMWDENADWEWNPWWIDYFNDEEWMDFDEFSDNYLNQ